MSKNPLEGLPSTLGNSLGDYLREQRVLAKLSVRQLSALAGISNPYLSQIERGVKRPSAEILQQIAKGLSISAESLYVQAGLLDPKDAAEEAGDATRAAIGADPALTSRQRQTLLDIYESFVREASDASTQASSTASPKKKTASATKAARKTSASTRKASATTSSAPAKKAPAGKSAGATKATAKKKATTKKAATKKAAPKKTTAGHAPAASTKGSARSSGSRTSVSRASRSTPTSSSTSTPRRSS